MNPWLILVIELVALFLISRVFKGKSCERVIWIVLAVLSAVVGFFVLWFGIGDSRVFQPNFWAVTMICVLRLGDIWKEQK